MGRPAGRLAGREGGTMDGSFCENHNTAIVAVLCAACALSHL